MRKRIALALRRLADRLDPLPKREPVTPLEFIPSEELATEIKRRNDTCIVFFAKCSEAEGAFHMDGQVIWRMQPQQFEPIFTRLADELWSQMDFPQ